MSFKKFVKGTNCNDGNEKLDNYSERNIDFGWPC